MQTSQRVREWILVGLVALVSIVANLPEDLLQQASIDRAWLLGLLALTVFIALFLYLKFQAFFLVFALALLANLPSSVSDSLGISRMPLVIAMALMVGISLINYVVALLPTGLETKPREKSKEGIVEMFYGIEKGNFVYAQKVLSMNFDPNLVAENGYTPLMYAAARGDAKMVDLLVRNGADVNMRSRARQAGTEVRPGVHCSQNPRIGPLFALREQQGECADLQEQAQAKGSMVSGQRVMAALGRPQADHRAYTPLRDECPDEHQHVVRGIHASSEPGGKPLGQNRVRQGYHRAAAQAVDHPHERYRSRHAGGNQGERADRDDISCLEDHKMVNTDSRQPVREAARDAKSDDRRHSHRGQHAARAFVAGDVPEPRRDPQGLHRQERPLHHHGHQTHAPEQAGAKHRTHAGQKFPPALPRLAHRPV